MILPTKHLLTERSLLGVGGDVLCLLEASKTVSRLWRDLCQERERQNKRAISFERYVMALDFLFLLEVVEFKKGRIYRGKTE